MPIFPLSQPLLPNRKKAVAPNSNEALTKGEIQDVYAAANNLNERVEELENPSYEAANSLDGTEKVVITQSGAQKETTTQDIADLGGSGSSSKIIASGEFNLKDVMAQSSVSISFDATEITNANPAAIAIRLDGELAFLIDSATYNSNADAMLALITALQDDLSFNISNIDYDLLTFDIAYPSGGAVNNDIELTISDPINYGNLINPNPAIFSGGGSVSQENILDWIGDNSLENCAPYGYICYLTENDTYATIIAINNSASISIDGGATGVYDVYADEDLLASGDFTGNKADTIADIITQLSNASYSASNDGDILSVTEVIQGSLAGKTLIISGVGAPPTSGGTTFSGGQAATDFSLQIDGEKVASLSTFNTFKLLASQLTFSKKIISTGLINAITSYPIFNNSGDISVPVIVGTLNDFRIKISILGERID